ncbi:Tripartite ATP-independent transporter, DctM component [Paramaledivibacter caminithermalis DSM 15212]|uniref:Tripartite ATP-independent transporter, DctM component n=1 Tax=Paramaledivibacter caminithermalis (strain DSM 15212 / CIP 107654 / DViRD3) TaxID=1121301 RepID=A0A1M6RAN7_PARC5|nr:Tripartite ATP-independent transporter, DctM component [Paramaledivibacter caminithermalis DSM 15212]
MINALLLVVGTFMETNAAIIILVPILLPVVTALGVNPVQFGLIMVLNLAIGFVTPPLGANLFMACQISDIKFDDLAKAILPWILVMIVVLLLVTFILGISLTLPRLLKIPV